MTNNAVALPSSYVIDGGISFQELMASSNESIDTEERCLISKEKLDYTRIRLNCNHCFNYVALYNHLTTCKRNKGYASNAIECPYCREMTQHVLPMYHDPYKRVVLKSGVNSPSKHVLPGYNCNWVTESGKNAGTVCACQGAITPVGIYCKKHYHSHQRKEAKAAEALKKKEAKAAEALKKKEAKAAEALKKKEAKKK
jgi:hypothetical protein